MRKLTAFSAMVFFCLPLSGCIDIFQYITKDADGLVRNTIKITVSKTVFAMASGFTGESGDVNFDELFDDVSKLDTSKYAQFGAALRKVNDTVDVGYLMEMKIDTQDKNTVNKMNRENVSFIPKSAGKTTTIHIDCLGDGSGDDEKDSMTAALLATGKYRLVISKKYIPAIDKASIKTKQGETNMDFLDLHDDYLIEIPIPVIFMSNVDLILRSK